MTADNVATVVAVSASARHTISKPTAGAIRLLNPRQVHLIHSELHDELRHRGFHVDAGQMGENVTPRGIDLHALPAGTRLRLGDEAVRKAGGPLPVV